MSVQPIEPKLSTPKVKGALDEELRAMARLLRSQGVHHPGRPCMAITKLVPCMTAEDWQALLERPEMAGIRDWIAFPLEGDTMPFLRHLQSRLEELTYQTEHDALTGLFNRRAFDRILAHELNRTQRQHSRLALAVIDVDNFKQVNDTYGHPCGDEVLQALARVLSSGKRGYDVAARTGGEEFSLILPGAGARRAKAMVERLLGVFSEQEFTCGPDGHTLPPFHCTFSAGLALTRGTSRLRSEAFLSLADQALYKAKEAGKARVTSVHAGEEETMNRATIVQSSEKQFLFAAPSGAGLFDEEDTPEPPRDAFHSTAPNVSDEEDE